MKSYKTICLSFTFKRCKL